MRITRLSLITLFLIQGSLTAQVRVQWIDTTCYSEPGKALFFTNRKPKKSRDGSVAFRNSWTRQTGCLWFCKFDYVNDSILPCFSATKECSKQEFPFESPDENFLYWIYEELRIKQGIRNISFLVPGYARTFHNQVYQFMHKLQRQYSDSLGANAAFVTFAWGDQAMPLFYYKAKRAANRAANDFAIFQHMLEEFLSDSAYFETHPRDVNFNLVCMSMGGQMLKRYLIKRQQQGIGLDPVYHWTVLLVSDASDDSFQEGKGLDDLHLLSDSVLVVVNRRDGPLRASLWANMESRLGLTGPRDLETLPDNVVVWDVTRFISWEDAGTMGHCYFFRNQAMADSLGQLLSGSEVVFY